HHRKLVGVLGTDRRLRATWMRPVWQTVRVVRNRAELDSLARHEFAGRVVQHLVRVHVGVVVRSRYRFRMEVIRTRAERADHETVALERLVHGRWLVYASNDRLEVHDVERPRIEIS